MARITYLGAEIGAASYRLAGLTVLTPESTPAAVREALHQAIEADADCILVASTLAQLLPAAELQDALSHFRPLLAIVPEVNGSGAVPNLASEVRATLGIEA